MHKLIKLNNGLTLITVDMPYLESVTSMVVAGVGSRNETKNINGISHFLEHMFFKGTKKYPSTQQIASLVDGIGAYNNAGTSKEFTYYYIKSAAKHIELCMDILSSEFKESLLEKEEIDRERGVIIEEKRRKQDNPATYIWDKYFELRYGDQPLGWPTIGSDQTINSVTREDFINYVDSLYSPENLVLVFAGNLPKNINDLAEKYFGDLPKRSFQKPIPVVVEKQIKPKVNNFYKKTDQANLILGVPAYDRYDPKKYAAEILATILGDGMSSRLFIEVRERKGLAYTVYASHEPSIDAGDFVIYAGLKLEKVEEGLKIIIKELNKIVKEKVSEEELQKAKNIARGMLALRSESTNFLAEYFGIDYVLDKKVETFEEYLNHIDQVTADQVQEVATELFKSENYNLQLIGPFKNLTTFEKILQNT